MLDQRLLLRIYLLTRTVAVAVAGSGGCVHSLGMRSLA